jgi:hypothetical protein
MNTITLGVSLEARDGQEDQKDLILSKFIIFFICIR